MWALVCDQYITGQFRFVRSPVIFIYLPLNINKHTSFQSLKMGNYIYCNYGSLMLSRRF